MGLENNVFGIEIPTETVTEIKEGGRRVESEKKVFPRLRFGSHGCLTIAAGLRFANPRRYRVRGKPRQTRTVDS